MALLPLILALAAQERTSQSADYTVASFVSEETASETSGYSAHETALAFLRVVRVGGIASVAVRVGGVAAGRGALAPGTALVVVLGGAVLGLALAVVVAALSWGPAVGAGLLLAIVLAAGVVWSWRSTVALLLTVGRLSVTSLVIVSAVALALRRVVWIVLSALLLLTSVLRRLRVALLLLVVALLLTTVVAALVVVVVRARHVEGCECVVSDLSVCGCVMV